MQNSILKRFSTVALASILDRRISVICSSNSPSRT